MQLGAMAADPQNQPRLNEHQPRSVCVCVCVKDISQHVRDCEHLQADSSIAEQKMSRSWACCSVWALQVTQLLLIKLTNEARMNTNKHT